MRRPRRKLWILAIIIVAGAAGAGLYHLRREKPLKVRVAHTEKLPQLKQLVKGSGEIRTEDSIDIQAEIAGVIIEIPVREGDKVQKGQVLLKIDPFQTDADVQAARAQLGALEAEAAGQAFQIATAEANMARDEFLKKTAEVERRQAETSLVRSKLTAKREEELLAANATSKDQYELTQTQLELDKAQVDAAIAKIDQLDSQIKAARSAIEFARAAHDSVARRVEGAKSSLLRAEDLLKKTTITSTIDGVIVQLNVEEGERAVPGILSNPQATLMTIADFSVIEAELKVDETDIVNVKLDDPAEVVVDAKPEAPLSGRVVEIGNSPIVTASSMGGGGGGGGGGMGGGQEGKDFKVVVRLDNPPEYLRPGMSCESDITTAVRNEILVVPIQALTQREVRVDAQGRYLPEAPAEEPQLGRTVTAAPAGTTLQEMQGVFLTVDGRARFQPVKTGITGEMDIEVIEGLAAAQEVIVGPLKALRTIKDNDRIEIDREHPYRRTLRRRAAGDSEEDEAGDRP